MAGWRRKLLCGMLAALGLLAACSASFRNHGFVPRDADIAAIVIGQDTKQSLSGSIGPPATSSLRQDNAWYYVESKFRKVAFQAPQEIERRVLRIRFDARGNVSNVETFGLEQGQVVRLTSRITDTALADVGILEAIFGNLGRTNAAGLLN